MEMYICLLYTSSTDKAPSAIGPYSQAVEINGMVYTSGVIPVIPATGEVAEGGVEAQMCIRDRHKGAYISCDG